MRAFFSSDGYNRTGPSLTVVMTLNEPPTMKDVNRQKQRGVRSWHNDAIIQPTNSTGTRTVYYLFITGLGTPIAKRPQLGGASRQDYRKVAWCALKKNLV